MARTRTLAPIALAASTLALAACGERELETAKNERFIRGVVVRQIGVQVKSVACPDGLKAERGATFTCVVTGTDGSKGAARVRQTDDLGNIAVTAPFLHMREVEDEMEDGLSRQVNDDVTVTCQEIVVVENKALFTCKAGYGRGTRTVSARMTDTEGAFRYRLDSDSDSDSDSAG